MSEILGNDGINNDLSNQLNSAGNTLANTLNQSYETLHTFKDFDEFKNSQILNPGIEFEPNIINFTVTDELIDKYSEIFNDAFTPHVILDEGHQSFPSKLLGQNPENNTKFLQGLGTLSFLNGFVRRIFKFQDKTELLTPKMDKVIWPTPNPSGSNITSKFTIKDKKILDVKFGEKTFEAVKIVFDTELFSDKIIPRHNEEKPRPVCIAKREMLYISPNEKTILSWSEKYLKNGSSLVSPILPGSYLLEILGYKEISGEYLNFKDKEITDIGSGLGGLIFELENSAKKINAVDPLYSSENKLQVLQKEIIKGKNRIEDIVNNIQKDIKKINNKIEKLEIEKNKNPSNHQFIYDIQDLESKKKSLEKNKNFELNQKVLKDLKKWEDRGFENSEKINLIGESGEDTRLPNNSQDYIFISNVITKESVNVYKLLTEAFRILKPGGKIIIVDEHQEVEKLFKKIGKDFKKIGDHIWILELKKEDNNILEND